MCESKAEWVWSGEVPNERAEQRREYDGDHPEGLLHLGQVAGSRNLDDGVRDRSDVEDGDGGGESDCKCGWTVPDGSVRLDISR